MHMPLFAAKLELNSCVCTQAPFLSLLSSACSIPIHCLRLLSQNRVEPPTMLLTALSQSVRTGKRKEEHRPTLKTTIFVNSPASTCPGVASHHAPQKVDCTCCMVGLSTGCAQCKKNRLQVRCNAPSRSAHQSILHITGSVLMHVMRSCSHI